jgi:hypothetical protein
MFFSPSLADAMAALNVAGRQPPDQPGAAAAAAKEAVETAAAQAQAAAGRDARFLSAICPLSSFQGSSPSLILPNHSFTHPEQHLNASPTHPQPLP